MSGHSESLITAWVRYDATVLNRLKGIQQRVKDSRTFRLYPNVNRLLYEAVEDLEKGDEFSQLLLAIQSEETAKGFHKKSHHSFWEHALTNILRRSRYYLDRAGDQSASSDSFLSKIMSHFGRKEKVVTFLAPMEYLYLDVEEVRCGTFAIKRFTEAELNQLFERSLRETFFPWAVIDTTMLSDYWFIVITERRPVNPLGRIDANLGEVGKVRTRYSHFPAIERALQTLALVDWQPDWSRGDNKMKQAEWEGWLGFRIPFLLRHSDHLVDRPSQAPNLSLLDREPNMNSWTGEEEGDKPTHWLSFTGKES